MPPSTSAASSYISPGQDSPGTASATTSPSAQAREQIILAIRRKAEETIAHLQQDVFRLIDQTGVAEGMPIAPVATQGQPCAPTPAVRPAALSAEQHDAIVQVVRTEIANLKLPEVVGGEVRSQMQAFAEQLQERMATKERHSMKKAGPLASRRRR